MARKIKACLILSLVLVLVVSAVAAADKPKEIRFTYWRMATEPQGSIMQSIIDKFEANNPDIKIVVDTIPFSQYIDILTVQVMGGDPPDLVVLPFEHIPRFVDMDAVTPLDRYLERTPGFLDQFFDFLIPLGNVDGVQYGLPVDIACNALYVNLDLLEQAGLPSRAPESFEEFVEFSKKLTDPSRNLAAFGLGGASEAGNYSRLNALFWACGARIFGDDDKTVLVDTPEGIAAMERIVSLHRDLRITTASPIELGYTDMLRLFMNEQVAMIQANIGTVAPVQTGNPDMDFMVFPLIWDDYGITLEGAQIIMMNTTRYPDEAWRFIQHLLSFESVRDWTVPLTYLPSRPDVVALDEIQQNPYLRAYYDDIMPNAKMIPRARQYGAAMDALFSQLSQALLGRITPEEAARAAAEQMRQVLD
jgi:ABC-type glycerol-3-phosphate transport system substrate-binding protein